MSLSACGLLVQGVVAGAFGEENGVEFGRVLLLGGQVFFGEDGRNRALGHACAAVNAGVGVNVVSGPVCFGLAGDDTFDGADLGAGAIADTQIKNHMSHWLESPCQ